VRKTVNILPFPISSPTTSKAVAATTETRYCPKGKVKVNPKDPGDTQIATPIPTWPIDHVLLVGVGASGEPKHWVYHGPSSQLGTIRIDVVQQRSIRRVHSPILSCPWHALISRVDPSSAGRPKEGKTECWLGDGYRALMDPHRLPCISKKSVSSNMP
jgi:hypothetical protein